MRTRPSGGPWPMQRATRPTSLRGRTATEDRVLSVPLSAFGVPEHVRGYEEAMASYTVNRRGVAQARKLIKAKRYVLPTTWGAVPPKPADETAFLKDHSWQEYAGWFLGLTEGGADETKARYAFVYGDLRSLHRSGLSARGRGRPRGRGPSPLQTAARTRRCDVLASETAPDEGRTPATIGSRGSVL